MWTSAAAGEVGGAAVAVLVASVMVLTVALLPALAVVMATAECLDGGPEPSALAVEEIPTEYLALYLQAQHDHDVPWTVLAAIGWVESRHGTLDAPGVHSGANAAGAAGPMQFGIGGRAGNTWGGAPVRPVPPAISYGLDGNGDGIANVYDPADAIPAAAVYLRAHGAPEDMRAALFAYNRADWYVERVLDRAATYDAGGESSADVLCMLVDGEAGAPGAWGGHSNGRIPTSELCSIGGGHLLRCDAAAAFVAMNAAHMREVGRPLVVTDSYRDYAAQVDLKRRKPTLAASPGTSNHGWGLAVDLAVGGWNGTTFRWLNANAGHYGWVHPPWARRTGSLPEPWHWEYQGFQSKP